MYIYVYMMFIRPTIKKNKFSNFHAQVKNEALKALPKRQVDLMSYRQHQPFNSFMIHMQQMKYWCFQSHGNCTTAQLIYTTTFGRHLNTLLYASYKLNFTSSALACDSFCASPISKGNHGYVEKMKSKNKSQMYSIACTSQTNKFNYLPKKEFVYFMVYPTS